MVSTQIRGSHGMGGKSKPPIANKDKAKKKAAATPTGSTFAQLDITPEWDQLPELVELDFELYADKRQKLSDEIKFRQEKLKELDQEIMSQLAAAGAEKVLWEGRPVQIVHSNSGARIKGEKLLMLGVAADTIAQATEPGKEYEYLLFGKVSK